MHTERARPGWPEVVVAGAFNTAVSLMRHLARRGVRVRCFDCNPRQVGFRTVYGPGHLCPDPDERPDDWLRFMVDLARRVGGRPVLVPAADQYVSAIARHADALREHFRFHHAAAPIQALLATKERQYEVAADHDMPTPASRFIRDERALVAFAEAVRFPCVLKPLHCRHWESAPAGHPLAFQKVIVADSPAALLDAYRLAAPINPELVVQEAIEGPDTAKLVYLSAYATDGRRLAGCVLRQVRTDPIGFGSASVVEPVDDPEVDAVCDAFLRRLGYAGLCEIELKRDARDGRPRLIETNPRYSVTSDAAPCAGLDLGWLHYLDLIGEPVTPAIPSTRPFRHIVLTRDASTIASYRRAGLLSWRELFRSYRPPVAFFDLDWRDWRVTLDTLARTARLLGGQAYRKLFPRRPMAHHGPLAPRAGALPSTPPDRLSSVIAPGHTLGVAAHATELGRR